MTTVKRTTLILGAGTSMPYKYPSGEDLKYEIIDLANYILKTSDPRFSQYFSKAALSKFKISLERNHGSSIDAFLEVFPDFTELGRLLAADIILLCENQKTLLDREIRKKGIYKFLFNTLIDFSSSLDPNDFSIITFNYDLSLEQDFYDGLLGLNYSENQMMEFWQKFPIFHINGKFGGLSWQDKGDRDYGSYQGIRSDYGNIEFLIKNILPFFTTANDEIKISPSLAQHMKANLMNSQKVYFLGFSYHKQNMEKIQYTDFLANQRLNVFRSNPVHMEETLSSHIRGTCLGMSEGDIEHIKNEYNIGLAPNTMDDITFLKSIRLLE
ncbi:MAG: hypothetical protein VB013_02905 [Anaerolineaceae bacterium]|nr:hypothetical protein [Anaerolineaceae bacterium]